MRDITELTGLTKGSIYGNFENKEAVAQAVYRYNAKNIGNQLLSVVQNCKGGAQEKIVAILDYYRDNWEDFSKAGGCPLLNAATEVDDPQIGETFERGCQEWPAIRDFRSDRLVFRRHAGKHPFRGNSL